MAHPGKQKYATAHKVHAIAIAKALGVSRAAEITSIPYHTLYDWFKGKKASEVSDAEVAAAEEEYRQTAARLALYGAVQAFIAASSPEKLAEASALEAAKVGGILADKWLLLTGRATSIVEGRNLNVSLGPDDLRKLRGRTWVGDSVSSNARIVREVKAQYRATMREEGLPPAGSPRTQTTTATNKNVGVADD